MLWLFIHKNMLWQVARLYPKCTHVLKALDHEKTLGKCEHRFLEFETTQRKKSNSFWNSLFQNLCLKKRKEIFFDLCRQKVILMVVSLNIWMVSILQVRDTIQKSTDTKNACILKKSFSSSSEVFESQKSGKKHALEGFMSGSDAAQNMVRG